MFLELHKVTTPVLLPIVRTNENHKGTDTCPHESNLGPYDCKLTLYPTAIDTTNDKINEAQMKNSFFYWVENIMEKGENAGY